MFLLFTTDRPFLQKSLPGLHRGGEYSIVKRYKGYAARKGILCFTSSLVKGILLSNLSLDSGMLFGNFAQGKVKFWQYLHRNKNFCDFGVEKSII